METWVCQSCGNTNYKDDENPDICIRCNWDVFSKWAGVHFNEAVSSPDWRGFGWICPVCGNHNAGEYPDFDVCPLCGWEDDHLQRDNPDYPGGANRESLNEYRAKWEKRELV